MLIIIASCCFFFCEVNMSTHTPGHIMLQIVILLYY